MARKKKRVHEMIDTKTENLIPPVPAMRKLRIPMPLTKIALAVLILGIVAIFVSNKGLLVAAIVNGRPIFRWQLNQAMTARFGQQTLEGMISEALIADEARKSGISVSQADIDAKVSDIVASLGGTVSIDDLLKYQGMSRGEFENQIRLQLTVEKLLGRDIVVTDDDVKNFIATNSATLTATDEAGLKEEARDAIMSAKINEKLQSWFLELKDKAKILRFI
ncbi:MAG: PpiC-type peptidyl-prolyl cis-trans isomerase [Candidatus Gottesmanbacteria bacterium GW2011_GWB1_49_7]|uniref:PpiC-type peptidyl-prolyl cis-trans isomerase n=1 Tax=Candidatus Gottesmanbacteria bacterium GW2011_GWB1_49_7 TaxID=1618448 RepID=A0A0G1YD60_9BACT|nr:MAG: PpiC-type peptidyl-prolyl cis-trans isomerase [Candidatus Gottesmanbacteria bacterium GW2011_GWB1_49_7]